MKNSLISKIFSVYVIVVCFLLSMVLFIAFHTIKDFFISAEKKNLSMLNEALVLQVKPYVQKQQYAALNTFVKEFGKKVNVYVTVVKPNGSVIADSLYMPEQVRSQSLQTEIVDALQKNKGTSLRRIAQDKSHMLYAAQAILVDDTPIGVVRTSIYLKEIEDFLQDVNINIFRVALVLLLFSLLGVVFSTRVLSDPIIKLRTAALNISQGDLNTKVFIKGSNEFSDLAENFNEMTAKLNSLFLELSDQKEELNTVIASMQEALVVIDADGRIDLVNSSFEQIAAVPDIQGRYYWEVLREPVFIELMDQMKKEQKNIHKEILLRDDYYLLSGSVLSRGNKVVLLLYDITEAKNLEKMKKEFVINVSHELRTPLTAMKGFIETLDEELGEKSNQYVSVIKRHTDRLIHIVEDLLLLSSMEEKNSALVLEKVNIVPVINNALKIYELKAAEKNITISFEDAQTALWLKGDEFMLEQVFVNLIDNAIKYSENGTITVRCRQEGKYVLIQFSDTGIGIPKEDLGRIFERFFVVNKSRSRKLGGTGLGLSIVKHIVLLHSGTITVQSEQGKGSTFSIRLQLA